MAKKLWFVIAACALAAAFVGCQSDVTEPTTTGGFDTYVIEGYVKDAFGSGIAGADVDWYRETEFGLELIAYYHGTDGTGWYGILYETAWTEYEGDDLVGIASADGYGDGYAYITDFELDDIPYIRDFTLYPE